MSSLQYPWPETPAPGETIEVAPGIHWLSMPLPFALDHINLWLVQDEGGWTIVDTGIGNAQTRELWDKLLERFQPIRRVLLTHYHPDHAGNADWLCQRYGVELWTTQGEYLTAHAVGASGAGYTTEAVLNVFRRNGLDDAHYAAMSGRGNRYRQLVPDFPHAYRRIIEGDVLRVGKNQWRAIIGHGHAPEHLSLDSIARYRELPADVLVLPSHGKPFRGAHERVAELEAHHRRRFDELKRELSKGARSAGELLPVMFRRPLDAHQTFFAMGEAIAHLHYLYYAGEAKRTAEPDGIMRYAAR